MAWNIFKYCSGLRVIGYLMFAIVTGIVGVSYYGVVVVTSGSMLRHGGSSAAAAVFVIILFHVLLVLLLWSYVMAVFTDPGSVPQEWRPIDREENPDPEAGPSDLSSSSEMTQGSEVRYCNKCQKYKPPRCHHCSVCQRCVLKMDHHCIWIVNCAGARNYKFFLLFLVYTFLETVLDAAVMLPNFISFFTEIKNRTESPGELACVFLASIINLAFALSLLGFLIMHASLLLSNTTTIEVYEKKKTVRWKYDLGKWRNFEQVFGLNRAFWFIPMYSKEDLEKIPALHGLEYPTCIDAEKG